MGQMSARASTAADGTRIIRAREGTRQPGEACCARTGRDVAPARKRAD
jgi:hypothetical protein